MKEIVKPKKFYTVYKITNLFNGKIYIGFHSTDDLDDGYMGSGVAITRAVDKYGLDSFKKEYIQIFDNAKEAEDLEKAIVNEEFVNREDTYNLCTGGIINVDANRYKMSKSSKGKKKSPEHCKNISLGLKGRETPWIQITNRNPEKIRKMAEKHRGMKRSEESKKRMSEAAKGKTAFGRGKVYCYNPLNYNEKKLCLESEIPEGWIKGFAPKKNKGPKKVYSYNPETMEQIFCVESEIPEGYVRGNPKLWDRKRKVTE